MTGPWAEHRPEPPVAATVGIAQWLAVPGQPAANEATAVAAVRHLAAQGCDVVVLPELWPCGYDPRTLATDGCTYLVTRLPLRDSLSRAARDSGPLLTGRRPALYGALAM